MKARTLSVLVAASCPLLVAGSASAEFLGIDVVKFTDYLGGTGEGEVLPGNFGRTTGSHPLGTLHEPYAASGLMSYRLYATFSQPIGYVALLGASFGPNQFGDATALNGTFWHNEREDGYGNPLPPRMLAPQSSDIAQNPMAVADSYVTLGQFVNPVTQWSPSETMWRDVTQNMGDGLSTFSWVGAGVILGFGDFQIYGDPSQEQQGLVNDGLYRVLLMQLTIMPGEGEKAGIEGNIGNLGLIVGDSQTIEFDRDFLAFSSGQQIPAPGALALLGLVGLVGARRRR
jgi:MYXO-CTERM domain-containing protein